MPSFARAGNTLAERLGLPAETKLLILHGDDVGLSHAVNKASLAALKSRHISSVSLMAPTPWVAEAASLLKDNASLDAGVHVTLNSEWTGYKWQPVSPFDQVPSLVDAEGHLLRYPSDSLPSIKTPELRREVSAQIAKLRRLGLQPTHLDTHMGTVTLKPEWLATYVELAKEHGLLPMLVRWSPELAGYFTARKVAHEGIQQFLEDAKRKGEFMLDRLIMDVGGIDSQQARREAYRRAIESLQPGVTQIITHLSADEDEMIAMSGSPRERRRVWDYEILAEPAFQKHLHEQGVHLIDWGTIARLLKKP